MEFIAGFFVGTWWIFVIIFGMIGALSERNNARGWALFWLFVCIIVSFVALNASLATIATFVAMYIPIGILWSLFKWRHRCKTVVASLGTNPSERELDRASAMINITYNKDKVAYFIVNWPLSMISTFAGGLIDAVESFVKSIGAYTYARWSGDAMQKIDKLRK